MLPRLSHAMNDGKTRTRNLSIQSNSCTVLRFEGLLLCFICNVNVSQVMVYAMYDKN